MEALKFLKEERRMCASFDAMCVKCPLGDTGCCIIIGDTDGELENEVATVEQWSKANPETDISKCRCCGYENIEEARQNFEKQLARGERSADEAKAYTIRKENAVPFTVDKPADDEWLKKHAEDVEKVMRSNVVMGRLYAAIDEKAAVFRETVEDRILCEWQLKRADVEDALRERDAYRATGLTPEEVERSKLEIEAGCVKAIARTYGIDINRLRKLAEADRDGRVVVMPCKVGTATYYIHYPIALYPDKSEPEIKRGIFTLPDLDCFGHSVFLTREEAEKALKEDRV